jgi:AcrR family transcriptional regulator
MAGKSSTAEKERAARKQRSDGERSRTAILDEAARLATVEGISGLSLSRLADAVGMSKSGLFAHFGSKEELQLATVETANSIFEAEVLEPASQTNTGLERLRVLLDSYLRYVESGIFPGGCFFATVLVEVSMQPGAVRDRLLAFLQDWLGRLESAVKQAQREGDIDRGEDAKQLAFELESALLLANTQFAVVQGPQPIKRARRAIGRRIEAAKA